MKRWPLSIGLCFSFAAVGCSDPTTQGPGEPVETEAVTESDAVRAVLAELRDRHRTLAMPADEHEIGALPAALVPVLPEPAAIEFRRSGSQLRPYFEQASSVRVHLPTRANGAFRIESAKSALAVDATLRGMRDVEAEVADGYVVYRGALAAGGALLHRVTPDGTEDYLTLEERPRAPRIDYEISLSREVRGLRLVENVLEFVDASGNPELRVSEPYLIGADGKRVEAKLDLNGCAVDRNPAAPWDRPVVDPGARSCEVSVSWNDAELTYPAILDPSWTATGNMISGRTNHTATLLSGQMVNPVLVTGGFSGSSQRSSAELYNPTTRTWASTGSMTTARMDHTATLLFTGGQPRVFVAGGGQGTTGTATAEVYNPTTGTWSAAASLPSARFRHAAVDVAPNQALIIGGTTGTGTIGDSRLYDVTTNTWTLAGTMVVGQERHTATRTQAGGQQGILVVGVNTPAAQFWNQTSRTWSALANQPAVPRRSHAAAVSDSSNVVVAGGIDVGGTTLGSVEIYTPGTGTWRRTGSMRYPRAFHTLTAAGSFQLLAVGNASTRGGNTTEVFNSRSIWEPGAPTLSGRFSHTLTGLPNGRKLLAGGTLAGTSNVTSSAEELLSTPVTGFSRGEYKDAAVNDPLVLGDMPIELWASVTTPSPMVSGVRYPLIMMLHGSHHPCGRVGTNPRIDDNEQYTTNGTCPTTPIAYQVVNNHAGYDYIAEELAERGYIVVSVNANRGIGKRDLDPLTVDDYQLIKPRGALVLRHLQKLSKYNRGVHPSPPGIPDLRGKIDLGQVGFLGHSRGGEGMRSAYEQYRAPGSDWPTLLVDPMTVRGIFEIAPTDGIQPNPLNTRSTVLMAMCDGDARSFGGMRPFDRTIGMTETNPSFKAVYTVWGANHNFFNTEWQRPDSTGCFGHRAILANSAPPNGTGSEEQKQTAFHASLAFFRASVGTAADPTLNQLFDPRFPATPDRVDRSFHPGSSTTLSRMLEDFINATGTSSFGFPNVATNIAIEHDDTPDHPSLRAGTISWPAGNTQTPIFQTNFTASGSGLNLSSYQYLDLRTDRAKDATLNPGTTTDFVVVLVNGNGSASGGPRISKYLRLEGPVGRTSSDVHTPLQTARIPLSEFGSATLSSIRGVRLIFDQTPTGKIYVANIRVALGGVPGTP